MDLTEGLRWTDSQEKIAGVSAILLFIFMFFDWFGVEVSGVGGFSGSVPGRAAAPGTPSTSSRSS